MTWLVKRYDSLYLGERGEQKREQKFYLEPVMTRMDKKIGDC